MIGRTNAVALQSSQNQPIPESPTTHKVIFIDPFGVVNEQWVEDGTNAIVPTPRVHDYLTFVEWNQDTTNITSDKVIGATYDTTDGKTYAFITLTDVTGLDLVLYLNKSDGSTLTIDWGDETTSTFTDSGNFNTGTHTYAATGDYIITMWISSGDGTFGFGNGDTNTRFIGGLNQNQNNTLTKLFVGESIKKIHSLSFVSHQSLSVVVLSNNINEIGSQAFTECYRLKNIIHTNNIKLFTGLTYYRCYQLVYINVIEGTSIIPISFCRDCYSVPSIILPNSVISIGQFAFNNCFAVIKYKIYASTPPTLSNVNAFSNINSICKIYVPDASLTAYKTATNWATYENYIYPLSDIGE